jgi:hypothetical protein
MNMVKGRNMDFPLYIVPRCLDVIVNVFYMKRKEGQLPMVRANSPRW